jgi:hypothetical protein
MPVFHVDICVGDSLVEDLEGIELADLQAAEAHCVAGLIEVAKSLVTADTRQCITTTLRDEFRNLIFERTMTLTCEIT